MAELQHLLRTSGVPKHWYPVMPLALAIMQHSSWSFRQSWSWVITLCRDALAEICRRERISGLIVLLRCPSVCSLTLNKFLHAYVHGALCPRDWRSGNGEPLHVQDL